MPLRFRSLLKNRTLNIEGNAYYNGNIFNLSLDSFETYQIAHLSDLTGTLIESSFPIAAFSGNECTTMDGIGYCDHLIAQLPPTNSVDDTYIVPPNSVSRDTIIRITAVEKSEVHYVIGTVNKTILLDKSIFFDTRISSNQTCFIKSTVTGFENLKFR